MPRHIGTCFRFYTQMRVEKKTKHLPIESIVTSHNSVIFQTWHLFYKKFLDQIQFEFKRMSGFINSLYRALELLQTTTKKKMRCKYKSAKKRFPNIQLQGNNLKPVYFLCKIFLLQMTMQNKVHW